MKAVIVAAGLSQRLRPLTDKLPKCFLEVGGKPLIEYSLNFLQQCGVGDIAFVTGHCRNIFPQKLGTNYYFIPNPFFAFTNNMASLWLAKEFVGDSAFLYLHSDLLYHPNILQLTLDSGAEISLAVAEIKTDSEMMKVRVAGTRLIEMSKNIPLQQAFGEWTGIAKFTNQGWQAFEQTAEVLLFENKFNAYDAEAFTQIATTNIDIQIVAFKRLPFIEIDDAADLQRAENEIRPDLVPYL